MKATEMLKQVKDLLGIEASEEIKNEEVQEEIVEETQLESQEQEVQEETLAEESKEESKEVKLATAELENGTVVEAETFSEGNEIFIVTEDEKVALPIGTYTLSDGQILTVEEEGIIANIGEAEATEEVEAAADYATKEELAEVKKAIEDIVTMIEELGYGKKEEEMSSEESKENLSQVEKVKHNPESEEKPELNLYAQNRPLGTLDRVMKTISNFN